MDAPRDNAAQPVPSLPPLPIGELLRLARSAAEQLCELHRSGHVHGAVCADNVLRLAEDGTAVLLRDATAPPYPSPEQAAGGPSDARTDVYGLGRTLATLLGDTQAAPEPLTRLIAVMVADTPQERYQSMDDVLTALDACEALIGSPSHPRRGSLPLTIAVLSLMMLALAWLVLRSPTPPRVGEAPHEHNELRSLHLRTAAQP